MWKRRQEDPKSQRGWTTPRKQPSSPTRPHKQMSSQTPWQYVQNIYKSETAKNPSMEVGKYTQLVTCWRKENHSHQWSVIGDIYYTPRQALCPELVIPKQNGLQGLLCSFSSVLVFYWLYWFLFVCFKFLFCFIWDRENKVGWREKMEELGKLKEKRIWSKYILWNIFELKNKNKGSSKLNSKAYYKGHRQWLSWLDPNAARMVHICIYIC